MLSAAVVIGLCRCTGYTRPQGHKTFSMLGTAELEIFSANKYETANNSWNFHIY